jgi:hypothetical protein
MLTHIYKSEAKAEYAKSFLIKNVLYTKYGTTEVLRLADTSIKAGRIDFRIWEWKLC